MMNRDRALDPDRDPPCPAIRIAFADDHPLILEALDSLFRSQEDFEIVAACGSGAEALRAVRQHRPDVLILDLRMPDKTGIEVLRELAAEDLRTRTILLTEAIDEGEMLEAWRFGVRGVLLKGMATSRMVQCARKVHRGEPWLENRSAARALQELLRMESESRQAVSLLTARELEIARLIGRGLHNKEIASRLSITDHTVKSHLSHIYTKVGVDSRLALLRYGQEKGLF
jgi:DNA-binding NarL/FixJ family response regulator